MLPPLLYSDKCNHSLFCTANTNSYAQKLNQVKKRVNFLLWKLKALSKILMTIRRFVHFQPNFFTHLVPLWLWVPGGRNSTCFTYHISPVSRHFRHKYWMKEGRNAFDSWAPGTKYLSSRNICYVKLNSQSQSLVNEADTEIGY